MSFVIKQEYVEPHICNTPPQTENKRLVPGDVWICDDCGNHFVWGLFYDERWYVPTARQLKKILKRHEQKLPFKRLHAGDLGIG